MKGIIAMLMMVLLLVPTIAAAQQERGAITTTSGWFPSPLTLTTGSATMEYSITTQNTGLLPFYGRTLITLSGKQIISNINLFSPSDIPGRSSDCWTIEYTSTDYSTTTTICGGSGATEFEIETPPAIYEVGASNTATLTLTTPTSLPEGNEFTLVTAFEDFSTGNFMDFRVDQIESTTAVGEITLAFIQLVLTIGGLATILGPLGLAFI